MRHVASYVKNHPNPQLYRENYELLNGEWDFAFDDEDIGLSSKYYKSFPINAKKIIVPFAYQTESSLINEPTHQCDVIWYHKKINIKEKSDVINLIFNGVDYQCELFVNGELIGSHFGGYDIFKFDIAPYVNLGENDITLRIVDKMNVDQIRGKQRWKKESFECFYTETSGIWKDVYIEYLNESHITNFKFIPSFKNQTLKIKYEVSKFNANELEVLVKYEDQLVAKKMVGLNSSLGELTIDFKDVHGWSPENPNLYDVVLTLKTNDKVHDQIKTYFGFNDIAKSNGRIYLNNKDTYLKLILDQGYYPGGFYTGTEEQFIKDISIMKDMGFNGCRKHEKIETPLFNYYCDVLGFLLWQELPSSHCYSYNFIKTSHNEITRQINDHFNHPSIMCYVIFNESWGVFGIANSDLIINDSVEMYEYVKSLVPNKFVISNDGWEHTKSDLLTFHNYDETYEQLYNLYKESFKNLKEGKEADANTSRKMYAKGFKYQGEPLIFSEFCGLAFTKDKSKGWGYNLVNDETDFVNKIRKQIEAIRDLEDIRGYCFTQLSDVEIEVNGLVDFERNLKIKVEDMNEINSLCK